jgi:hypothetical protein
METYNNQYVVVHVLFLMVCSLGLNQYKTWLDTSDSKCRHL